MQNFFHRNALDRPKRERTRSLLIDGAVAVVAERGITDASIKAITESVGLSNGTFYNHFEDRDALFREAALAVAGAVTEDLAADVSDLDRGLARFARSTDAFMLRMLDLPDWAALLVQASHHLGEVRQDIGKHLRSDLRRAVDQGTLAKMPNRFTLHQIGSLITLAIEWQLLHTRSKDVRRQTCESTLRLLGLDAEAAMQTVRNAVPSLA